MGWIPRLALMFIGHPQKCCDTAQTVLFSLERLPHPNCKSRLPFTDPLNLKMQMCFPERQSGRGEEEEEPINKEDGLMWNRPQGLLMTAGCSLIKHSETWTKSALRVTNSPILPLLHKSNPASWSQMFVLCQDLINHAVRLSGRGYHDWFELKMSDIDERLLWSLGESCHHPAKREDIRYSKW